ncbi:MAG: hypothetical protein JWM86_2683 [Thermoleophilia bacterium]|nr:hypothetical protein [Thermoleophilia bacterium]
MRNAEIADAFAELADRLALTDEKPFRYMAYRRAETLFREMGESVATLSAEGRLREVEGVGPAIDEKVSALIATGTFPALERARGDVPDTLLRLTRLSGVGPSTAHKVYAATGEASFESLLEQAASGSLQVGNGVTKKVVEALAAEAARRAAGGAEDGKPGDQSGVPLDEDGCPLPGPWLRRDQAEVLLEAIASIVSEVHGSVEPTGAFRRGAELMREVEALVDAGDADPDEAGRQITELLIARGWEEAGRDDFSLLELVSPAGIPARVHVASSAQLELARHVAAGPSEWLVHEPEPRADGVPVELRDAVLVGRLSIDEAPRDLVEITDFRGDLHAHSTWSDGRAAIIEMARAARDRGDAYLAMTDHSAPYAMVGGLDPARIKEQAEEIRHVNEQLEADAAEGAPRFRVLRGSEVEILADGSLGLDDETLRSLDWVVASIHTQQRQDATAILERMRRVLDNPLVDAIGHPTSRRLLRRERTALDVDVLIELAVAHGVALEINANPDRLDLDSAQAAAALAAGARLTVNTDAHRTTTLRLREHGVAVARRAGARAVDIVNCLELDALLASRRRTA